MNSIHLNGSIQDGREEGTRCVSLYCSSILLRDGQEGKPLYVYHIASVRPLYDELHAVAPPRRYERMYVSSTLHTYPFWTSFHRVSLYESMVNLVMPLCTHVHPTGETIFSSTTIIDLSSLTLGSLISLRSHLQEASKLATANYPETLHRIAVVNAPSFFPIIWGWIKGWFDEVTRDKIYILAKDMDKLKEVVHEEDLPKAYGGALEWSFHDEPLLDNSIRAVMPEIPKGPAVYVDGTVKATKDLD